jgi:hypothetical protein
LEGNGIKTLMDVKKMRKATYLWLLVERKACVVVGVWESEKWSGKLGWKMGFWIVAYLEIQRRRAGWFVGQLLCSGRLASLWTGKKKMREGRKAALKLTVV